MGWSNLLSHVLVLVLGVTMGYLLGVRSGDIAPAPLSETLVRTIEEPVVDVTSKAHPIVTSVPRVGEVVNSTDLKKADLLRRAAANNSDINRLIEDLEMWLQRYPHDLDILDAYTSVIWESGDYENVFNYVYSALSSLSGQLYHQRLQRVHQLAIDAEQQLIQTSQQHKLIPLYQHLSLLEPEYIPYYLKLSHWAIELKQWHVASQALEYVASDIQYQSQVQTLQRRLSNALATQQQVLIPLERKNRHFFIDVEIDGQAQAHLLIDTGASLTVVKPSIANALGIDYEFEGEKLGLETANGRAIGYRVTVDTLSLGDIVLGPLDIVILELASLQADGLLGMNALDHYPFFIDQENQQLVIEP